MEEEDRRSTVTYIMICSRAAGWEELKKETRLRSSRDSVSINARYALNNSIKARIQDLSRRDELKTDEDFEVDCRTEMARSFPPEKDPTQATHSADDAPQQQTTTRHP